MTSDTKTLRYYGTNPTSFPPEAEATMEKCREEQHPERYIRVLGRCYEEYGCTKCGYAYRIDSSD